MIQSLKENNYKFKNHILDYKANLRFIIAICENKYDFIVVKLKGEVKRLYNS